MIVLKGFYFLLLFLYLIYGSIKYFSNKKKKMFFFGFKYFEIYCKILFDFYLMQILPDVDFFVLFSFLLFGFVCVCVFFFKSKFSIFVFEYKFFLFSDFLYNLFGILFS